MIGFGNPLRRDDGVGPRVAGLLVDDPRAAGTDVLARHQLTLELAEDVHLARLVVLVDADLDVPAPAPGQCRIRAVSAPDPGGALGAVASHHCTPEALVASAGRLYGSTPPVFVVGVGVASVDEGESLTPQVERGIPTVVDVILDMLHQTVGDPNNPQQKEPHRA